MFDVSTTADVVVVGGGSAGAVLAAPAALLDASTLADADHDWGYISRGNDQTPRIPTPRGKVLGGSSAVNAGVAVRARAADFVHPNPSPDPSAHALGLPDSLIDYPADTTRAIARLHYSNAFARTPDVKYVFSHAGGTVPYLAGRFGIVDAMRVIPGAEHRATAAETFRRLYWDTALSWGDPVLRMLREVMGIDRVVFGSDYPYLRRDLAVAYRQRIESSPELTGSERTAILGGTATELIPRLANLRSQRPLSRP